MHHSALLCCSLSSEALGCQTRGSPWAHQGNKSQHLGGTPEKGSDAGGGEGKHMNCLAWCWGFCNAFCMLSSHGSAQLKTSQHDAPCACPRSPGCFSALTLTLSGQISVSQCFPLCIGDSSVYRTLMIHPTLSFLPSVQGVWKNSPNVCPHSRRKGSIFLWCEEQGGQAGCRQFLSKIEQKRITRGMWLPCLIPQRLSCSTPFSRGGLSPLCVLCYTPDADNSTNCGEVCYWNDMYTGLLGEVEFQEQWGNGRETWGL